MKNTESLINEIMQAHYDIGLVVKEIHLPRPMLNTLRYPEYRFPRPVRLDFKPGQLYKPEEIEELVVYCDTVRLFECAQLLVISEPIKKEK